MGLAPGSRCKRRRRPFSFPAERARSFPWRHGDPKIRNRVNEQRLEDAGEETPADRGATSLAEAIAMVLGAKKSGAL